MSSDAERLAELVTDLGRRLSEAFGDVISPEAQRHLRNAQREALTALFLVYEEQLGRRTGRTRQEEDGAPVDDDDAWPHDMEEVIRGARPEPREPERPPPPRVKKITLD